MLARGRILGIENLPALEAFLERLLRELVEEVDRRGGAWAGHVAPLTILEEGVEGIIAMGIIIVVVVVVDIDKRFRTEAERRHIGRVFDVHGRIVPDLVNGPPLDAPEFCPGDFRAAVRPAGQTERSSRLALPTHVERVFRRQVVGLADHPRDDVPVCQPRVCSRPVLQKPSRHLHGDVPR